MVPRTFRPYGEKFFLLGGINMLEEFDRYVSNYDLNNPAIYSK